MPTIFDSRNHDKAELDSKTTLSKGKVISEGKAEERHKATIKHPKTHAEINKLPGHTHNPLAAFYHYPDRTSFVNKDPEEKIILLLRKHPITNLGWIILAFIMLVAPGFVSVFEFFTSPPAGFQVILIVFWYLLTTAFIFEEFLSWFFHVNIITDERIIEVDFINLIYREITDANIDQIQDVTVEMGGATRTFFNYGNVIIQTAAVVPKIDFEMVPQPDNVAKILRELRVEEEVEKLEGRVR